MGGFSPSHPYFGESAGFSGIAGLGGCYNTGMSNSSIKEDVARVREGLARINAKLNIVIVLSIAMFVVLLAG